FGIFSTIPAAESRSTIRNAVEGFTSSNSAIRARLLGPCPSSTTSIRYCGSVKLSSTAANERAAIATNNRDAVSNSPTTRSLSPSTSGRALHDPGMHTFLPATTTTPPHPCPMQQPHHPPEKAAGRKGPRSDEPYESGIYWRGRRAQAAGTCREVAAQGAHQVIRPARRLAAWSPLPTPDASRAALGTPLPDHARSRFRRRGA